MDTLVRIVEVVLGVGFLVFIHEFGHFLAARICRVRVLVFSLGFGPRIGGFVRDGCDYRLSLVPVGGYVRMVGDMGDEDRSGDAGALSEKPAHQRFFVYSAGVLMNLLIAFAILPVVFAMGVPFTPPIVGSLQAGGPAWKAGIAPGSRIRSVNGTEIYAFEQIHSEVALGPPRLRIELDEPLAGAPGRYAPRTLDVTSEYSATDGVPAIGIERAARIVPTTDPADGAASLGLEVAVTNPSVAYDAGVRTGDLLVEAGGVRTSFENLGPVLRALASGSKMRFVPGTPVATGPAGADGASRTPEQLARLREGIVIEPRVVGEAERPILGIEAAANRIKATRSNRFVDALSLREGDHIVEANGALVSRPSDLEDALNALDATGRLELVVRRGVADVKTSADIPADARRAFLGSLAFTQDEDSTRVAVRPDSPAEKAGLRSGDRIVRIGDAPVATFREIQSAVGKSNGKPLAVDVAREVGESPAALHFEVTPEKNPDRATGLELVDDRTLVKASSASDAFRLGFRSSIVAVTEVVLFLKKIALGEVAASKNLGGPISIATVTFRITESGFAKLLFFLAILSINLALINLLPIPVLDGGNLFFVIVEKIKGSPVSDRVLGASQTLGMFLLIALMVWVTFHDVRNVFGVLR